LRIPQEKNISLADTARKKYFTCGAVNIFAVGKGPFCSFFNLGTGTFSNRKGNIIAAPQIFYFFLPMMV
jgi:hypothetical protein